MLRLWATIGLQVLRVIVLWSPVLIRWFSKSKREKTKEKVQNLQRQIVKDAEAILERDEEEVSVRAAKDAATLRALFRERSLRKQDSSSSK